MKLTKKKSLDICKELWVWLAETGKRKEEWSEWEKYGVMAGSCPFCEYDIQRKGSCNSCPLTKKYGGCWKTYFKNWEHARTIEDRKKYAGLFLKQLEELKEGGLDADNS